MLPLSCLASTATRQARWQTMRARDWKRWNEARTTLRWAWHDFFQRWDFLVTPIMPTTAFAHDHAPFGQRRIMIDGAEHPYFVQTFWAGLPGVAYLPATIVPAGPGPDGLPIGVQIIGPAGADLRTIGLAQVSTCADELFGMGLVREGDRVCMDLDGQLGAAKAFALALVPTYRPGRPAEISAPGRSLAASLKSQLWNLEQGGQVTPFERLIAGKVADILCGGDVPAGTPVAEPYLLDLEREGFLSLCGEQKTLERINHLLKTGKPLRN